jgi:hypothetical protein
VCERRRRSRNGACAFASRASIASIEIKDDDLRDGSRHYSGTGVCALVRATTGPMQPVRACGRATLLLKLGDIESGMAMAPGAESLFSGQLTD